MYCSTGKNYLFKLNYQQEQSIIISPYYSMNIRHQIFHYLMEKDIIVWIMKMSIVI